MRIKIFSYACELGAPARNGDGIKDVDEDCDDGNDDNGDGCDNDGTFPCSIGALPTAAAVVLPDGRCWVRVDERLSITAANARCASEAGATLTQQNDAEEQAVWARLIGDRDAWIGLIASGDAVSWPDGSFPGQLQNFEGGSSPDADDHVWFSRPHGHGWAFGDGAGEVHDVVCEAATGSADVVCGDGVKDSDEGCDDGNDIDGDGCSDCAVDCGDGGLGGFTDAHGACVNLVAGGCGRAGARWEPLDLADIKAIDDRLPPFTRIAGSNVKRAPGDFGVAFERFAPGEPDSADFADFADALALDDGFMRDVDGAIVALSACVLPPPICGNSVVEGDEDCDDGNDVNGDGCDSCAFPCAAGPDAVRAIAVGTSCFWARASFNDVAAANSACAAIAGGKLAEPRTREEVRATGRLDVALRKVAGEQGGVLLGMNDSAEEGVFVFNSDGAPVTVTAFVDGEGANDADDCLMMRSGWRDVACNTSLPSVCQGPTVDDNVCGDGVVGGLEECDDGNDVDGDGCETSCALSCGPAGVARIGLPLSDGSCAWLGDDDAARGVWSSKALSYCNGGGAPNTTPLVIDAEVDSRRLFAPELVDVYDELGVVFIGITEDPAFGFPGGVTFGSPGHFQGRQPANFGGLQSPTADPADNGSCFGFIFDGMTDLSCFGSNSAPIWCSESP